MVLTRNVCVTVTEDRFNINAFLEAYARPFVFLYSIRRFSFSCYLYVLMCVMCVYQRYWYEQSRLRLYLFGKCRCESSFTIACKSLRESVLDRILIGYMYRCMIVVNMYKVCVLLHPPRQKGAERGVLDTYICASICVYMNPKRRLAYGGSVCAIGFGT